VDRQTPTARIALAIAGAGAKIPADVPAENDERPTEGAPLRVLSLARYTLPLHALLPVLIATLGREREVSITIVIIVIHLVVPLLLALTYPLWRGQGGDLVLLLLLNHIVTFAVGFGLVLLLA